MKRKKLKRHIEKEFHAINLYTSVNSNKSKSCPQQFLTNVLLLERDLPVFWVGEITRFLRVLQGFSPLVYWEMIKVLCIR